MAVPKTIVAALLPVSVDSSQRRWDQAVVVTIEQVMMLLHFLGKETGGDPKSSHGEDRGSACAA